MENLINFFRQAFALVGFFLGAPAVDEPEGEYSLRPQISRGQEVFFLTRGERPTCLIARVSCVYDDGRVFLRRHHHSGRRGFLRQLDEIQTV